MLNSTGALLGFFIAPVVLALFPTHDEVMKRTQKIGQQNIVQPLAVLLALIPISSTLVEYAMLAVFIIVVPLLLNGQTLGGKLLRVQMLSEENKPAIAYSRRYLSIVLYYGLLDVLALITALQVDIDSSWYVISIITVLIAGLVGFTIYGAMVIHVLRVLFSKGKRAFYFDEIGKIIMTRKR